MWILHAQRKHFAPELNSLATGQRNSLRQQLGLFLDERKLLRCQGRLGNAGISESTKHPVLLPRKDHLTNIIKEKMHIEVLHSDVSQTLAKTRQKYWIPKGRGTVKNEIQRCNVCRRFDGDPYQMPPMPTLPTSRVTESRPFLRVGLDYMGPVMVKSNGDHKKVWTCLFTCLVTRGVHLEIVLDLSTVEFLLCLRRFVSQKGTPIQIISDNAAQFMLASGIFDKIWCKTLHSEDVQSYVSNSGIMRNFITELAPWMGGFYERLVGLVKKVFKKALGRRLLTLIQLQTLVKEAEAVVNYRPLVYVGDDVNSNITLTPSHFLTLNPSIGIPESVLEDNDADFKPYSSSMDRLLEIWKKGQKLLNMFWNIWRNEYLLSLRERTQTRLKTGRIHANGEPSVGNIVLLKDNLPRGCWKIGKIISLVESRDGLIRTAKVKTASGRILGRPLNLLFPIETSVTADESYSPDTKVDISGIGRGQEITP